MECFMAVLKNEKRIVELEKIWNSRQLIDKFHARNLNFSVLYSF
jgi:hypothetical protein